MLVVYRVKCLIKIHGEHVDSHTVGIVNELAHFFLKQDKSICTWTAFPVRELRVARIVLFNLLSMELVDNFLKSTSDDGCHIDFHVGPYCPSGSPVSGEGWCWPSSMILAWVESDKFHRLVNNRCKYLSLVSPYPIRDLVRTGGSFLQPFYLEGVGGGGGGTQQMFKRGGSASRSDYTIFTKKVPLSYTFYCQMVPLLHTLFRTFHSFELL